jgi:hypothetical protein
MPFASCAGTLANPVAMLEFCHQEPTNLPTLEPELSSSNVGSSSFENFTAWRTRLSGPRSSSLLFWFVAVAASLEYAFAYGRNMSIKAQIPLAMFAEGQLPYPFRRRLFMRWVYHIFLYFMHGKPHSFKGGFITSVSFAMIIVSFLSIVLAILAARLMIFRALGRRSPFGWAALLVVLMCSYHFLLVNENVVQFPYDMPSVAFFGLCTYAAFARNRWLYYSIFVIGSFNRESTLFLPPLFFILGLSPDMPLLKALRSARIAHYLELAAQLALWKLILMLCDRFSGGPGQLEDSVATNLHLLHGLYHWPMFLSLFGFTWIAYVLYFDRIGNVGLQRCALLAPLWAVAMFLHADFLEIRVNSEWIVYMTVCIALIVSNSIQFRPPPAPLHL